MDYKVRLKVKSRSLLCRKLRGVGIAVKPPIAPEHEKGIFCRSEAEMQWCIYSLSTPTSRSSSVLLLEERCRPGAAPGSFPVRTEMLSAGFAPISKKADRVGESPKAAGRWGLCLHPRDIPQIPHRHNPHHSVRNCRHLSWGSFAFKKY